jgi:F0F1-type ATP synthase membrane subunit b/b'
MKISTGEFLAGFLVLVLLVFEVWQYFDAKAYRETMNAQLVMLSIRVDEVDERVQQAKQEMEKLEGASIGGLIENANDALIQGWSAMLNSVEKELQRAKKGFEKQGDPGADPQATPATPDGTSPL